MRYRVEELARACGVSVDTVRFYQTRGLLPRPEREGRVAWYGTSHRERLERIRQLKDSGFTLTMIERLLAGGLDASEEALALAIAGPLPGDAATTEESLTLAELAERTGVSPPLLEALQREGLLVPRAADGEPRYTAADAAVVRSGLQLLESGVPLSELLELARRHDAAVRGTAEHAVELFARFVRDPIRADAADEAEYAERTVAALHAMLPATTGLVTHHFQRLLLDTARARIEAEGDADGSGEGADLGDRRLQA